jgi:hypothetical protein
MNDNSMLNENHHILIFLIKEMTVRNILELYFLFFMSINVNKKDINVALYRKPTYSCAIVIHL